MTNLHKSIDSSKETLRHTELTEEEIEDILIEWEKKYTQLVLDK
jgi:hypothetical protein